MITKQRKRTYNQYLSSIAIRNSSDDNDSNNSD